MRKSYNQVLKEIYHKEKKTSKHMVSIRTSGFVMICVIFICLSHFRDLEVFTFYVVYYIFKLL